MKDNQNKKPGQGQELWKQSINTRPSGNYWKRSPPYISARALARICGMSESLMLQYKGGFKKISPKNIALINEKMRTFASELSEFTLLGA